MSFLDKRIGINFFAIILIIYSFYTTDEWSKISLNTGLFALSGAVTNWLAIYMLFERVPGLYGTGIIELHFESFKKSIHEMIMKQFFSQENVEKFFTNSDKSVLSPDLEKLFKKINLNIH